MEITKLDIALLRGGFPEKCDFCKEMTPPAQLEPEEAGDWVCWRCLLKWAIEDGNVKEEIFWKRAIREATHEEVKDEEEGEQENKHF